MTKSSSASSGWLKRLQTKWGLHSTWQVFLVLLVFALAGSSVVFVRKRVFWLLGLVGDIPWWVNALYYILFLPFYQLFLLFYGFLLGQFDFFWDKNRKFWLFIFKKLGFIH